MLITKLECRTCLCFYFLQVDQVVEDVRQGAFTLALDKKWFPFLRLAFSEGNQLTSGAPSSTKVSADGVRHQEAHPHPHEVVPSQLDDSKREIIL